MQRQQARNHNQRMWWVGTVAGLSFAASAAFGGGATDGSVGPIRSFSGDFILDESLGTLRGSNLFHSFSRFSIDANESATFTTTTSSIANVISRVTGGETTSIHGSLTLTPASGAPNFFLVNPAGVVFGDGAQINVPAGFHVSTAQKMKFSDGFEWETTFPSGSSLTVAPPEAFRFVGGQPAAAVSFNNRTANGVANGILSLSLKKQSDLTVSAGSIQIDSAILQNGGGRIKLSAVGAAAADVAPASDLLQPGSGRIDIRNGQLRADSVGPLAVGSIAIEGSSLTVEGSLSTDEGTQGAGIFADRGQGQGDQSEGAAGRISVMLADGLAVLGSGSIQARGLDGKIDVRANAVRVGGRGDQANPKTGIFAESDSNFPETNERNHITVIAKTIEMFDGGEISTLSRSRRQGGDITIEATTLSIDRDANQRPTGIFAGVIGAGPGGNINLKLVDSLSITRAGLVSASARSNSGASGKSSAGNIQISVPNLLVDGLGHGNPGGIVSEAEEGSNGQAGKITIISDNVVIRNEGRISTQNLSNVNDPADVVPRALSVFAPNITLANGGKISAETAGNVVAGTIVLSALQDGSGALNIQSEVGGARGQITSSTRGVGAGGGIEIRANNLVLSGLDVVSETASSGAAGQISADVSGTVSVLDNTRVATDTTGAGNGGNVLIHAGNLMIDPSEVSSNARPGASGNAGSVTLNVDNAFTLVDGGRVSSSTESASGAAGNIAIAAGRVLIDGDTSGVFATAANGSSGQPGSVTLSAREAVTMTNGGTVSIENRACSAVPDTIQPTSVLVDAPNILISGGAKVTSASTQNIAASRVRILFDNHMVLRNAAITTTAQGGNGGAVGLDGRALLLDRSQVTTSVLGLTNGNGGDIDISVDGLALNNGFIRGNTAAREAFGGNVNVAAGILVPSGGQLQVAGDTPLLFRVDPFSFNVIQAAAPDGVSGNVEVGNVELDATAKLRALREPLIDLGALGRDLCQESATSSLTVLGQEGLPFLASDPIRVDSWTNGRLSAASPSLHETQGEFGNKLRGARLGCR
jgi:filamentous hemagglutinin family protein